MNVHLIFSRSNIRQSILYDAVRAALLTIGWRYTGLHVSDLVIRWGASSVEERSGKPTLVMDFPFWERKTKKEIRNGYYKISLNGVHPTKYLEAGMGEPGRYAATKGPIIKPWRRDGEYILIAGMGPKGSSIYRYLHGQWDRETIETIQRHTDLPVVFRPKPSDKNPPRLPGIIIDDVNQDLSVHFSKAAAIVTHHGNAALEAMMAGVPAFCHDGPATLIANRDFTRISNPVYSDERTAFFEKLAYWQWSYEEIVSGKPFLHLKKKGLI